MPLDIKAVFSSQRGRIHFSHLYNDLLQATNKGNKTLPKQRLITFITTCAAWTPHECVQLCQAFLLTFKELVEDDEDYKKSWRNIYEQCITRCLQNTKAKEEVRR